MVIQDGRGTAELYVGCCGESKEREVLQLLGLPLHTCMSAGVQTAPKLQAPVHNWVIGVNQQHESEEWKQKKVPGKSCPRRGSNISHPHAHLDLSLALYTRKLTA